MKHEFFTKAPDQYLNIAGQNNVCISHVVGYNPTPNSLQGTLLNAGLPGVSASNGDNAKIQHVSLTGFIETDLMTPINGKVLLVAADGFTQQTKEGPTGNYSSMSDILNANMTGYLSYKEIGQVRSAPNPRTDRQWLKFYAQWRPSKGAKEQGWDTVYTDLENKYLFIVVVLMFNAPGLGVTKNSWWTTKWTLRYALTHNVVKL